MSSESSSNAAMSLWQKFAELQNTADSLRSERRTVEQETERLKDEIQRMKRQIMESKRSKATNQKKEQTLDQDAIQAAYAAALQAKNAAELSLERWKTWKQDEMERNMAYERSFRVECEQWKLRALAVGLEEASIQAVAFSKDPANACSKVFLDSLLQTELMDKSNDPLSWDIKDDGDDEELKLSIERYRERINERQRVESIVHESRAALQAIVDKQVASDRRSSDFQNRLDAIAGESKGLESSLAQVEELILHEEALVQTYRNKLKERSNRRTNPQVVSFQQFVHQSPDRAGGVGTIHRKNPKNPYVQNRTKATPTVAAATTTPVVPSAPAPPKASDEIRNAVLGPQRRPRRDRYFGCPSLSIQKPAILLEEDSDDDCLLYSSGITKKAKKDDA